jgi:3-deoxy-D-manno-octulosonate 8-phosphate phosphatase (KDO 8-P phosphatase)
MLDKLKNIKMLICDVDGILTDGKFIIDSDGRESKIFHALDGVGFVMLRMLNLNIITAWITGREAYSTQLRADQLQIDELYNGVIRKIDAYNELKEKYNVNDNEICFIGDDIIDLPILEKVGCPISVPNAPDYVKSASIYVTQKQGGEGAVREVIDLIIQSKGDFENHLNSLIDELK